MAIRVRAGRRVARVHHGRWTGDPTLAALGAALEPTGGVRAAEPDPDWARARTLAAETHGEVLDQPQGSRRPPADRAE